LPVFIVGLACVALAAAIISLFLRRDSNHIDGDLEKLAVAGITLEE
jgi:hypothetical protein